MKKIILVLAILLIPLAFAQTEFNDYDEADIDLDISSVVNIKKETSSSYANSLTAQLYFFPKEDIRQTLLDISSDGDIIEDYIEFEWKPPLSSNEFYVDSEVRTKLNPIKITKKVAFPVKNLDSSYLIYTSPSEKIDSDDELIIKKASGLVKGNDDLFFAVNNIADWVERNIEYDLNTLTADASQKASWVLDKRYGVCDEITTLFVAMLRSVGIPARFVSGVAYTNYLEKNDFGPHAWAEVYFPGYGWVSYDITYNQFGYVDVSHVKLKESVDASESTTKYEWEGIGTTIETEDLKIDGKLTDFKKKTSANIKIFAYPYREEISFGSYNIIKADIKNNMPYYVSRTIHLSKSDMFDITTDEKVHVSLVPYEEKTIYWIIKLTDNMQESYIYTFPLTIYSEENITSDIEFRSSDEFTSYSLDDINSVLSLEDEENKKAYSGNIEFDCKSKKDSYYLDEEKVINCTIRNIGNIYLEDLNICLDKECDNLNLGISQEKSVSFTPVIMKTGKKELRVSAKNNLISKTSSVNIEIYDSPQVNISIISYPKEVRYDDEYKIEFSVDKLSSSIPYNVNIIIKQEDFSKEFEIDKLIEPQKFVLRFLAKNLRAGNNDIKIIVEYEDMNNRKYNKEETLDIELKDVTFIQRLIIFFNQLGKKLVA